MIAAVARLSLVMAQQPGEVLAREAAANRVAVLSVDFAVPPSPALAFLGITGAEVLRPTTVRELAVTLVSAIDTAGGFRQGLAIDVAPYLLGWGRGLTVRRYQTSALRRVLANTQISLGTVRASGDSGSTDVALGVRITLLDHGDLRRGEELNRLIGRIQLGALPDCPLSAAERDAACRARWDAFIRGGLDSANARIDSLRRTHRAAHWNATRIEAGLGIGWTAPASEAAAFRALGAGAWFAGSVPLGSGGQLVGHAAWRRREAPSAHDALTYGGRVLGGSPNFNGFAEFVWVTEDSVSGVADPSFGRLAAGAELELAPDLWLELGFGSTVGLRGTPEKLFTLANLRWGLSDRPTLGPTR